MLLNLVEHSKIEPTIAVIAPGGQILKCMNEIKLPTTLKLLQLVGN